MFLWSAIQNRRGSTSRTGSCCLELKSRRPVLCTLHTTPHSLRKTVSWTFLFPPSESPCHFPSIQFPLSTSKPIWTSLRHCKIFVWGNSRALHTWPVDVYSICQSSLIEWEGVLPSAWTSLGFCHSCSGISGFPVPCTSITRSAYLFIPLPRWLLCFFSGVVASDSQFLPSVCSSPGTLAPLFPMSPSKFAISEGLHWPE